MTLFSFRVGREPAFLNSLLLLVKFQDGPETAEAENSEYGGQYSSDHQRGGAESNTRQGENPPASLAQMILCLYDYRMEYADY